MRTRLLLPTGLALLTLLGVSFPVRAAEPDGGQLYKQFCVRCHGANGEGGKKAQPLVGDKSVPQLANVIQRTMPDDDPGALTVEQARAVAAYIYDRFYSPEAQARLHPPRIDLTHLTHRQYRQAVADLIGSFRPAARLPETPGLRGEYFNSRGFQPNQRLIDRTDPQVNFDFGTDAPRADHDLKEPFDRHQFSIRWDGAVLAPDTGVYEFVVRTDQAFRLWVNNPRQPLIDGWVKSGSDTEFRASIFLLAGRAYPLRLEFSKAKQGVDDSKKNPNPPPKPAFISLHWKRPRGVVEVIPGRYLRPARVPEVAVIETPFPPDDRSRGWERGSGVSREWAAATTDAALQAASYVLARLNELAGTSDTAPDRAAKLRQFCGRFVERAFRRPLGPEEQALYVDRPFTESGDDLELAVKRVILLTLQSPRFLYPEVGQRPDAYRTAARLALILWDSQPDAALLAAAAAGQLATPEQVAGQAHRLLADPRATAKLREFLFTWLKLDQPHDLVKDAKRFPGFDEALAADLRTSLELFLDDFLAAPTPDFRRLLLADETYLNGRLARFYGVDLPPDAPFTKVRFEPDRRSGVLTHPYILAVQAYAAESSPIHRGVFVARGLLGLTIRPPQDAFTPLEPDLHPDLTTRERVILQTKPAACATCHGVMNPFGFALENFDAVGRYRTHDRNKPVDATGSYETRAGTLATFNGPKELARLLVDSPETAASFAERLFHHLVKQPVRAYGLDRPERLRQSFSASGYDVRKLAVEIAVTAALWPQPGPD